MKWPPGACSAAIAPSSISAASPRLSKLSVSAPLALARPGAGVAHGSRSAGLHRSGSSRACSRAQRKWWRAEASEIGKLSRPARAEAARPGRVSEARLRGAADEPEPEHRVVGGQLRVGEALGFVEHRQAAVQRPGPGLEVDRDAGDADPGVEGRGALPSARRGSRRRASAGSRPPHSATAPRRPSCGSKTRPTPARVSKAWWASSAERRSRPRRPPQSHPRQRSLVRRERGASKGAYLVLRAASEAGTVAMSLRPLIEIAAENERVHALAAACATRGGGEQVEVGASATLRPLLLATLLEDDRGLADRPALLVSADDRSARDLAADLRAYLAPRRVRFYPSRGTGYASHVTPAAAPGRPADRRARRAARRRGRGGRRQRHGARRGGPRRLAAPGRLAISPRRGDRARRGRRATWSRPATSGSSRSRSAASSRSAAASSTSSRRPRSGPRGSSCSATRSSRCAGSRPSPSARSATRSGSSWRPPPSSTPSTASWPSWRRWRPPRRGGRRRAWPRCCRWSTSAPPLDLVPGRAAVILAAAEEIEPALRDHWEDATDGDARRRRPAPLRRRRRAARRARRPLARRRGRATTRPPSAPPGPSRRRAASRRPRASWRSWSAPATARSSPSTAGGEAERARYGLDRLDARCSRAAASRPTRASPSPRRACARASSAPS